jgi:TolA-binding protein
MSKDLLAEATRALRETGAASELEARATRARVMSGLHQTRVRRRTRYAFLLPVAATFVAASAWGAASGNAQLVWASIERMTHRSAPAPARAPSNASKSAVQTPLVPPQPPAPAATPDPVSAPAPDPTPAPVSAPTPAIPTANPLRAAAATSAQPHGSDAALALYRAAHTAHFVDHDPARALSAWDAYLAAAPNGAFAPEAHYNRALSLVRLGRNTEARSALTPFATGAYGGYRQAEAAALLERLGP